VAFLTRGRVATAMPTRRQLLRAAPAALLGLAGCTGGDGTPTPSPSPTPAASPTDGSAGGQFALSSAAFEAGGAIPEKFSCAGEGVSPPLSVSGVPDDAQTLALVMDDPDAGERPYVHWLVWNVPADTTEWPEDIPPGERAADIDGLQGSNSAGKLGYFPSCPPPDDGAHTYRYALYALDTELDLAAGAGRGELEGAMDGHVVAETTLTGTFDR
jgi:Raf kinase inhibitor-like YbhB/YbcL family protein